MFLIIGSSVLAQNRRVQREEIEAQKRAYFTEKLNLTVEEAEKFWPLYNEFQDKRRALRAKRRELRPNKPYEELTRCRNREIC